MASVIIQCDCCDYELEWNASNEMWEDFEERWEKHRGKGEHK